MNKKKLVPIIIVAIALAASILYFEVIRDLVVDDSRIEGSGTIEVTEVDIGSKLAGRILVLTRDEGDRVIHGEVLVKLAYDELDAQRLSVVAGLNNAERNMHRAKELYATGAISRRDYDNAMTAYRVAKAGYGQINAAIENAVIASPIDGVVLARNLEVGEVAFPGAAIMTVGDLEDAWIKIYVSEEKMGLVKPGQKATITVDSYPGKQFGGKVVTISNRAEFTPKTIQTKEERVKLMYAVKIKIPNQDLLLKPGMPADAVIIREEGK